MSEPGDRDRYIAALRELAGRLEASPDLPLPETGSAANPVKWTFLAGEPEAEAARMRAASLLLGCDWDEERSEPDPGGKYPGYLLLHSQAGPLRLKMAAEMASWVCAGCHGRFETRMPYGTCGACKLSGLADELGLPDVAGDPAEGGETDA
jgi:hypothetical protein